MSKQTKSFSISLVRNPALESLIVTAKKHKPSVNVSAVMCDVLERYLPNALSNAGVKLTK